MTSVEAASRRASDEVLWLDGALVKRPELIAPFLGELFASHKLLSLRCLGVHRALSRAPRLHAGNAKIAASAEMAARGVSPGGCWQPRQRSARLRSSNRAAWCRNRSRFRPTPLTNSNQNKAKPSSFHFQRRSLAPCNDLLKKRLSERGNFSPIFC